MGKKKKTKTRPKSNTIETINNRTSFIRIKNRSAPIHPQSEGISNSNSNNNNNVGKKKYHEIYSEKKEVKGIEWIEEVIPSSTPAPFNPYKTQIKRSEKKIISKELQIRKENSPCIEELLQMRSGLLKEKEFENNLDKKRIKQQELISKLENMLGNGKTLEISGIDNVIDGEVGILDGEVKEEDEFIDYDDENEINAEFKERSIYVKERKYVAGRGTVKYHNELSRFQIYRIATRLYWSLTSTRVKPVSYILPWMYLGSKTTAANLQYLLENGFTHILNVTQEVISNIFVINFFFSILHNHPSCCLSSCSSCSSCYD